MATRLNEYPRPRPVAEVVGSSKPGWQGEAEHSWHRT